MLLRQTLLYMPAQVVGPLVQFVSIILWTYFLSPEEMGVFALITAAQEFAYIGVLFWFTLYTMRYFDKGADPAQRTQFLETERGVLWGAGLATTIGVFTMPLFITATWDWPLITAAIAYCLSRTIATHITDRARTAADTLSYSIMQIVWPILGLAIGWIFVSVFSPTASAVLWGNAIGQVLALAIIVPRLEFAKTAAINRQIVRIALQYGLPLVAGGLFVWLANNGIRFIIEQTDGAGAVGLITVGWGLGLRVASLSAMLVTAAAFPLAMQKMRDHGVDEGQAQLVRNGVLLVAVMAPAAAGLWAICDPLVERIVAVRYQSMTAAVMPWAIAAGAARNVRIHFGEQVFLLREQTMVPLVNDIIDGVLTLIAAAIGLAFFGLPGSVIGAAIGAVAALVVTLACGAWWHNFKFPVLDFAKIVASTAAMVMMLQVVPIAPTVMSLAIAICIGGVIYGAAMLALYPPLARLALDKVRGLKRA